MRTWKINSQSSNSKDVNSVFTNLVSKIGDGYFSDAFINHINTLMPIGCWSIYKIGMPKPVMYESGSFQRSDTTLLSWQEYLAGPHLYDASLSQPSEENKDRLLAHVTSHELTAPGHRERVYEQFGMTERVSVIETNQAGGVLALNLYRYLDQPSFSESDLSMISLLADPLFAIVKKHVEIKGISTADAETINQTTIEQFRTVLALNHSEFSERELDVCARLLYGMSYDGIAADLDLSLSTVKTYRNRAFSRLDINFKSELFRVFLHANRH